MPLTQKGQEILHAMEKNYPNEKKAKEVFYASKNAGKISGVDAEAGPPVPADYATKLDAVEKAMVRLGSRMDAFRKDADDTPAEKHGTMIAGQRELPR